MTAPKGQRVEVDAAWAELRPTTIWPRSANSSQSRSKKPKPGMTGVKPRADATRRSDRREEIHNAAAQRFLTATK